MFKSVSILKSFSTFFLLVLLPIAFYGQDKHEKKLLRLYKKEAYNKCLNHAGKKTFTKNQKNTSNYYKSIIYFQYSSNSQKHNDSIRWIKKSMTFYSKVDSGSKLPFISNEFNLADSIHNVCLKLAKSAYQQNENSKAGFYYDYLAKVFQDTLKEYYEFHIKKFDVVRITGNKFSDSLNELRKIIIQGAVTLEGTPYLWAGETPKGFDCSGFTKYVYKLAGIELPHNANMQAALGAEIPIEQAQPGDLILFGKPRAYHAGIIYSNRDGNVSIAHCVNSGVSIIEKGNSNIDYWLAREYRVKRIIGEEINDQVCVMK